MPLLGISMEESLKLFQLLAGIISKLDGSTEVKEPTHRGQFNFTFRRNVEELLSATTFCHGMEIRGNPQQNAPQRGLIANDGDDDDSSPESIYGCRSGEI